jgi:maleylacetate reductase
VRVPVVAIPTTYAGSEMTPIFGMTDEEKGEKVTMTDGHALPALVVYDPELTLDLPADLTASTGLNAVAHCVEGAYATTRSPVSTATALAGAAAIYRALPRCVADGHDLDARTELLAGAYLAGTTIAHAGLAVHHGLCHVLGGSAGVPHGVANSIMLPHAMRFNLPTCAPELAAVARALGLEVAGLAACRGACVMPGLPRTTCRV